MKKYLFIILVIFTISGCSPSKFSQENIMKLRAGLTEKEVISIFGFPDRAERETCGSTFKQPWSCTVWYYGRWRPMLIFQDDDKGALYLNSWKIK